MDEVLENLEKAILEYDSEGAKNCAVKAVEARIDPLRTSAAIIKALKRIGDGYSRGDLWLPELVGAAAASKSAMLIANEQIKRMGKRQKTLGRVVIGTVRGDIHDIGKSMVAVLLLSNGFEVIDLGVDISSESFISAVREHNAKILAMSALLTMTAVEQAKVIKGLKDAGIRERTKVMIGGAAITEKFAHEIGADGYAPTAPKAVQLAEQLIKR